MGLLLLASGTESGAPGTSSHGKGSQLGGARQDVGATLGGLGEVP